MEYNIQIVCVHWGNLYDIEFVNRLYRNICKYASIPFRFVCITDRDSASFDPGIVQKEFPAFSVHFDRLRHGCLAKLSMFAPGMLEDGIPALYIDLDTMVRGDVARFAAHQSRHSGLSMLRSHYLPLWRVQNRLGWLARNRYYFGNSSIMTFDPERCHGMFEAFNMAIDQWDWGPKPRHLQADDRFISYWAKEQIRVLPSSLAVKFTDEYMAPWYWMEGLRRRIPSVVSRRAGLVAVTFSSECVKPWEVSKLHVGDRLNFKRRKLVWNHPECSAYWRGIGDGRQGEANDPASDLGSSRFETPMQGGSERDAFDPAT